MYIKLRLPRDFLKNMEARRNFNLMMPFLLLMVQEGGAVWAGSHVASHTI